MIWCSDEIFNYCSTLRGPSHSLAARILDETGVYKNLLQEVAQRVGAPLPQYTTLDQVSGTCLFLRERLNWLESDSPGNQLRTRNKQKKCSHGSLDISKTIGERNCKFFFGAREQ